MTDPLAPDPFTPERVADLVRRVRIADESTQSGRTWIWRRANGYRYRSLDDVPVPRHPPSVPVDSLGRSKAWRPTSRSRVACRYAMMFGASIAEAARALGIHPSTVGVTWHSMYPGVPGLRSKR